MSEGYRTLISALAIATLAVVHEYGHFFVARAYGLRVTKFSIGFGPTFFKIEPQDGFYWFTSAGGRVRLRLWKHDAERQGPTVYQVGMIPFLAFVQIAGMNPFEEIDDNDKGSYANASLPARVLTIFGGPAANYLIASVIFFATYFVGGRPVMPEPDAPGSTQVTVIEGRPAEAASVKSGDRIVSVANVSVDKWKEMADQISRHPGEAIPVVIDREGQRITLQVTPSNERGKGKIGVMPKTHYEPVSAKEAAWLAAKRPPAVVRDLVVGLAKLATGQAKDELSLSGPVGMVRETAKVAQEGWTELFLLLGALSAYLGAFNLLPIPALDGGRLMFLGYEATTRKRPNPRVEAYIHSVGLMMMLGLIFYATVGDLRRGDHPAPAAPEPPPSATPSTAPAPSAAPASSGAPAPSAVPAPGDNK